MPGDHGVKRATEAAIRDRQPDYIGIVALVHARIGFAFATGIIIRSKRTMTPAKQKTARVVGRVTMPRLDAAI